MSTEGRTYTTLRVSRSVAEELEYLRERMKLRSIEDVLRKLLRSYRKSILEELQGAASYLSSFSEEDRGEDRWM